MLSLRILITGSPCTWSYKELLCLQSKEKKPDTNRTREEYQRGSVFICRVLEI